LFIGAQGAIFAHCPQHDEAMHAGLDQALHQFLCRRDVQALIGIELGRHGGEDAVPLGSRHLKSPSLNRIDVYCIQSENMSIWLGKIGSCQMDSGLPVKRTIADQVAELVRQRILTGQLKGGQPIRQEHLAAELGVSRIPLREALKQLAAEGFVTITSHKGAVVAELSIQEVEELFDIRLKLEAWLLQLAIPALTERDLAALEKNMDEQRSPDILPRWGDVNWRFHEIMYLPASRPITLKLLKNIHDKIDRYLRLEVT